MLHGEETGQSQHTQRGRDRKKGREERGWRERIWGKFTTDGILFNLDKRCFCLSEVIQEFEKLVKWTPCGKKQSALSSSAKIKPEHQYGQRSAELILLHSERLWQESDVIWF